MNVNASREAILNELRNLQPDEFVRIRKYTPREALRLMGVSDDRIDQMMASGVSDNQLYKQAGNSIVVSNLTAIFSQMFYPKEGSRQRYVNMQIPFNFE